MLGTLVLASVFSLGLCAGGYSDVSSTEYQQYETLLATAFSKDNTFHAEHNCMTTKIETQVVAGLNIRYTKSCPNGMTCTTVVYQKVWANVLDITSHTCTSAHKRMPGGYSTVTDQKSLIDYETMLTDLESSNQLTLSQYSVQKVETQVVAGVNIKYTLMMGTKTCEIIVWDVPWMHQRTVTTNTCTSQKRQLLGGFNSVDASNPQVEKCISMSLDRINAMSNSMFLLNNAQVLKAEQQVVAGMNYAVTFNTMPTTCMKGSDMVGKTLADCPLDAASNMVPSTWSVRCFQGLDGSFSVSNMHMMH